MTLKRALALLSLLSVIAGAGVYYRAKSQTARIPASPETAHTESVPTEAASFVTATKTEPAIESANTVPTGNEAKPVPVKQLPSKKLKIKTAEIIPPPPPAEETEATSEQDTVEAEEQAPAPEPAKLDLTQELQEERKDEPASFRPDVTPGALTEKKMVAEADPVPAKAEEESPAPEVPAVNVETETKVTVKVPEETKAEPPKAEEPVADNPAPALPAPEPAPKKDLLDQISLSPKFGYRATKTNRASNGQLIQLGTSLSPGLAVELRQNWSDTFALFAEAEASHYSFEEISGASSRNMKGTMYSARVGTNLPQTERISLSFYTGINQNFAVNVDSANVVEPVKYTRPEAGMALKVDLVKAEKGTVFFKPSAAYAFPGTHASDRSKGHAEYGAELGFEKLSTKTFHSTGAEIEFTHERFNCSQGMTTDSSLSVGLNFSFEF